MRLVTVTKDGVSRAGALKGDGVVDLSARMNGMSVRDLLDGHIAEAEQIVAANAPDFALTDCTLDLPVTDSRRIFCVGVNYMNRNEEYRDGSEAPKYPSIFVRNPLSLVAHGKAMLVPPESEQLDYEGEITVVIGKPGRRIAEADVRDHIGGLTIMNEGSIRDWIRHGKFNVTPGKNWDRSGGLGPYIDTDVQRFDLTDMRVITRVNGEERQNDTTASMAFPIARIINYVSTFCTLLPGDLIATGTPTGAGARFDPPKWLKPGDMVEVEVPGLGILRNSIAAEPV